jgi:cobalamin biosynthesis protein CobT
MTAEAFGKIGGFESMLDDSAVFSRITAKDFPNFVTRTIRLLGNNSGLKLRFAKKAQDSKFNPKEKIVYIPPPPAFPTDKTEENMEKFQKELSRWRGVLYHEVGHAQFTLWRADNVEKINHKEKIYPIAHHIFNDLFENGRMERVSCEHYPGRTQDLQKLQYFLKEAIQEFYEQSPHSFNHLYYALRMVVNGYEPAVPIPEELVEDWKVVREMAQEAWETDDEEETYEIARKVEQYIREKHKEAADSIDGLKKKEEELKENLENAKKLKDALEKGKISLEDLMGGAGSEEGGIPISIKSKKEDEEEEDEEDVSTDKECIEIEGEIDKEKEAIKEKVKELEEEMAKLEEAIEENIEEQIEEEIKKDSLDTDTVEEIDPADDFEEDHKHDRATLSRGGEVIPLPVNDYVQNYKVDVPNHSAKTTSIINECIASIAGLAQRFIQKVRSRTHAGVRTYRGRVSRRKIHRYKFDKNVFKTQILHKKRDASVMIIVDCSSSMTGPKIATARKAALVIGEMMSRAGVEFELKGFTIPYHPEYEFPGFTRRSDLIHYRFGGSSDWDHSKHCVVEGKLPKGLADNDDGESLRQFSHEIQQSKKDTKMMVVISDGAPCAGAQSGDGNEDLRNVVHEIKQSGVDIYAIGLDINPSMYYGAQNSVILSSSCSTSELVMAISEFVNMITVK